MSIPISHRLPLMDQPEIDFLRCPSVSTSQRCHSEGLKTASHISIAPTSKQLGLLISGPRVDGPLELLNNNIFKADVFHDVHER